MEVEIRMQHGVACDLRVVIPKEELDECLLSMPGWDKLRGSYGYIRHRLAGMPQDLRVPASRDPETREWCMMDEGIKRYKVPPEAHLGRVVTFEAATDDAVPGLDLVDEYGRPRRRLILIGNRNLGNNLWFVAWHSAKQPRHFHLQSERVLERIYTCLVWYRHGDLAIEPVEFRTQGDDFVPYRATDDRYLAEEIAWCTYGQQVLRDGKGVDIEEIIDQFYDIRHVLYFPVMRHYAQGQEELRAVYEGYPATFKNKVLAAWREGRPRSRYLHNAVGIGPDRIIILQRHGTVEEIGQWLRDEGAQDGLILDNGGSVFLWAWWAFKGVVEVDDKKIARTGNVIFNAPDWRPSTISLLGFVLKGPPRHEEPPGTVAMAMG